MGLVTCPDCGNQVSDRSDSCPKCGCPVKEVLKDKGSAIQNFNINDHPVAHERKDSTMSIVAAVLTIFTVTVIFGMIVGIIDLAINKNDKKRHIGSWFAIIIGAIMLILGKGRLPIFTFGLF